MVGILQAHVRILSQYTILSNPLCGYCSREFCRTHCLRPPSRTRPCLSSSTGSDPYPNHNNPLFRLVAEHSSLIRPRGAMDPHDYRVPPPFNGFLPQPSQKLRIMLPPQLLKILVGHRLCIISWAPSGFPFSVSRIPDKGY